MGDSDCDGEEKALFLHFENKTSTLTRPKSVTNEVLDLDELDFKVL